jgi:hypothetical protein
LQLLRLIVVTSIVGTVVGGTASSSSAAQACSPRTAATHRYDQTSFEFVFAIRLCDDRETIGYGVSGFREQASGAGTGLAADGVARCAHRLCAVTFGFQHEQEVARYRGDMFWGDVAVDSLGPVYCVSTAFGSGCRPPP